MKTERILLLTYIQLTTMIKHAKSSPNREICGAIMGEVLSKEINIYKMVEYVPIANVAEIGQADYEMDANELFSKVLSKSKIHMDPTAPLSFVGVFHNHPYWRPLPSEIDINGAGYAGIYIIYSNLYDDLMAWFNEGSDNPDVTTAMYNGQIGFGPAYLMVR